MSNNGGPVFPAGIWSKWGDSEQGGLSGGMTLRDYFAAKAMQGGIGLIPHMQAPKGGVTVPEAIAQMAYEYADAMLKQRGRL